MVVQQCLILSKPYTKSNSYILENFLRVLFEKLYCKPWSMETQNSRDFLLEPPQIQLPELSGAHFDVTFNLHDIFFFYKHLGIFVSRRTRWNNAGLAWKHLIPDGEVDIGLPDSAQEILMNWMNNYAMTTTTTPQAGKSRSGPAYLSETFLICYKLLSGAIRWLMLYVICTGQTQNPRLWTV